MKTIVREFSGDENESSPKKGLISSAYLSAKYSVLYKIGIANLAPSSHGSSVTPDMANLLFQIGTRSSIDFEEFVFEHLVRHAKSFTAKLPIGFPSLIIGILLSQIKDIMRADDVVGKTPSEVTFSHKLFEGKHARDIISHSVRHLSPLVKL